MIKNKIYTSLILKQMYFTNESNTDFLTAEHVQQVLINFVFISLKLIK